MRRARTQINRCSEWGLRAESRQMETHCRRNFRSDLCDCVNCKQGKLTKAQYTKEIRNLCLQDQLSRGTKSSSIKTCTLESICTKTAHRHENGSQAGKKENHQNRHHAVSQKNKYFIDEEVPTDLESFNLMMNGNNMDERILPAVVNTIKYLRKMYHRMLVNTKSKTISFFERERRFIGSKGGSSFSSDEHSLGENSTEKPRAFADENPGSCDLEEDYDRDGFKNGAFEWRLWRRRGTLLPREEDQEGRDSDSGVNFECDDIVESKNVQATMLHAAAKDGDVEKVMSLVFDYCDVNSLNRRGRPAVESALESSKFRCALFLMEAGTDMKIYTQQKVDEYEQVLEITRNRSHFIQTAL